jgi:6-phosphofructokinase 1
LIPEIPYDVETIADAIRKRRRGGKPFSIVAVAEGAISREEYAALNTSPAASKKPGKKQEAPKAEAEIVQEPELVYAERTLRLAHQLEKLTGLEARVTILGHLQRGGAPSAADRILSTRLGTAAADLIALGEYGVMVAARGEGTEPVRLEDVAGRGKLVPIDHPWVLSARRVGTNLGD